MIASPMSRRALAPVPSVSAVLAFAVVPSVLAVWALAPVLHRGDMLTTGAIAHRLICCAELDELSGEIMQMLQEVHS